MAARDHLLFVAAVLQRDKHVLGKRNHAGFGGNPRKRLFQVAAGERADIAVLPFVGHAQQRIRVHRQKPFLPEAGHQAVERLNVNAPPGFLLVEFGAGAHQREHAGEPPQPRLHIVGAGVFAAVPGRVGLQRLAEGVHIQRVMRRAARGSGNRRSAAHHVGVTRRPFVGLLRAHGPAEHQLQFADAEMLRHQAVLGAHIVGDVKRRKRRHAVRRRRVVRRTGQPVAELVRKDDEVARRVQRQPLADIVRQTAAGAGKHDRKQDGVVLRIVQFAVRRVGQFAARQRAAALQLKVAQVKNLERAVVLRRVKVVVQHCGLSSMKVVYSSSSILRTFLW